MTEEVYYHGTFVRNMPGILADGLGARAVKNFDGCEDGVYLTYSPIMAAMFIAEAICLFPSRGEPHGACVIEVLGRLIDPSKLRKDPNIDKDGFWLYDGILDVSAARVMTIGEAFGPSCLQRHLMSKSSTRSVLDDEIVPDHLIEPSKVIEEPDLEAEA